MSGQKLTMAFRLLGIGWFVAICIGGGAFGGVLLDRNLGSSPVFTLLGIGAGIGIAVAGMYRMLIAVMTAGEEQ